VLLPDSNGGSTDYESGGFYRFSEGTPRDLSQTHPALPRWKLA